MSKFGFLMVALLAVLCGAFGWAVVASPAPTASSTSDALRVPTADSSSADSSSPPATSSPSAPAPSPSPSPAPETPEVAVPAVPVVDASMLDSLPVAAAPSRMVVASLGVDVPVLATGLDDAGNMALPPDPANAGWYEYGPAPASPAGATVIAAHVDSLTYGIGPFAAFADAVPGTEIVVTDTAGAVRTYVVSSVNTTDKLDVVWASVFDRTGPSRLVVVTCGGEFDYSTRHYLSNVIVVATPVG